MLRRFDKKEDNSHPMGKLDREASRAWALIMNKIQELRSQGKTLEEIGKKLHVTRATVSRWISEDIGGERTTFGDMLRHAKALDVDLYELVGIEDKSQDTVGPYYQKLGKTLADFARDDETSVTDLAKKSQIPSSEINAIFAGEKAITVQQLHLICKALEIKPNIVLNRAVNED